MKNFVFILIGVVCTFQLSAIDPVGKIAKANAAKERAAEALKNGDYQKVIEHYSYLLDSLNYESPQAELNRAHAYFQLKDTVNAYDAYRRVSEAASAELKSKAMLQMGNLSEMQEENENALSFYKEALKADPTNSKARYNYELLKKKMQEQEKQNQDQNQDQEQDQNQEKQDQENKDQQNKENKDSENQKQNENQEKSQEDKESEEQKQKNDAEQQDGEQDEQDKGKEQEQKEQQEQKEGEQKKDGEEQEMNPNTKQKLEEMNISEEKAQMILEALRNKESQYFQQLRKKATKRQESGKPDW
jgi:hypothetical protein